MLTVWLVRTVVVLVVVIAAARGALFLWDYTFAQLFNAKKESPEDD